MFSFSKINSYSQPITASSTIKSQNHINIQSKTDTVSFCGNHKGNKTNPKLTDAQLRNHTTVRNGINLGKKLILDSDTSLNGIEKIMTRYSPIPVFVEDINNDAIRASLPANTLAHMLPGYKNDLTLGQAIIYMNPSIKDEKERSTFIADSAHEYTDVLQRFNDKKYYGLTDIFDNFSDIQNTARAAQNILRELVSLYAGNTARNPMFQKSMQRGKFQYTSADIEGFCSAGNPIKDTSNKIIDNNIDFLTQFNNFGIDKETLNKAVKMWIKQEALHEAEAYTVTLETLKKCTTYDKETYIKRNLHQGIYTAIYNSLE